MKTKYLAILGMAVAVSLTSCGEDFLYKSPQGAIDEAALTNATGVDMLTTSAYGYLTEGNFGGTPINWTFGSIYGGDANKGSNAGDQPPINNMELYTVINTNSYINDKWVAVYNGVSRCNKALNVISKLTDVSADQAVRKGELEFLRAFYYFDGIKVFGPYMPWVDDTMTAIENNPLVHNDVDIYDNVLADLDAAIAALPEKQSSPGRANKTAAKALKARVLMQRGDLATAKPILKDVIDNGVTASGDKLGLEDDLKANWDAPRDNGKESIFAIQYSVDDQANSNYSMCLCYPYGGSSRTTCCGFYQPTNDLANSYKVDADGLPYLDDEYREGTMVSKATGDDSQVLNTPTDVAVDPRLDFTVGRIGIPYMDWESDDAPGIILTPEASWIREVSNGGSFLPKKHVYTMASELAGLEGTTQTGWAPGGAMNYQMISFRDVLLLYAECCADAGELSTAMQYVNMVRARAAKDVNIVKKADGTPAANYKVGLYPASHKAFSDQATCIKAVRMERKLELAMEGQRWFDLARWGGDYMSNTLKNYLNFEKKFVPKYEGAAVLNPAKTMFPVPQTQIETMGNDADGNPYLVEPTAWQ